MSDEELISKEDIERLKSRDIRWKAVDVAIQVDEELRNSLVVNLILESLARHSTESMEELINTDPSNGPKVSSLQAMIKCARFIGESIESIRQNGLTAQISLEEEGSIDLTDSEGEQSNG